MKKIQESKVATGNGGKRHSNQAQKGIQLLKAIIVAFVGGYILQCISMVVAPLIIYGEIYPELLIPDWPTLVLVLFVFYVALPYFKVVDRKKWWKVTVVAGIVLAVSILAGAILTLLLK